MLKKTFTNQKVVCTGVFVWVCVGVYAPPPLTSLICVAPSFFDQHSHTGARRSKGKEISHEQMK